jgi:hypothetical protein
MKEQVLKETVQRGHLTVTRQNLSESVGGDVETVKGEAVFKAFQSQMRLGSQEGKEIVKKYGDDPDDMEDKIEWLEENAAEAVSAARSSLKVLEHYASTGVIGFDKRTMRATADLTGDLNVLFYRIGQLKEMHRKKK